MLIIIIALIFFKEGGMEGEREGERYWCKRAPRPGVNLNPGMCSGQESNQEPSALDNAQPTEPPRSGPIIAFKQKENIIAFKSIQQFCLVITIHCCL